MTTPLAGRTAPPTSSPTFASRTAALMADAQVVTGMRSPLDRMSEANLRHEDRKSTHLLANAIKAQPPRPGERVYVSASSNLRIQLAALRDTHDMGSGQRIPGENRSARFRDGIYRVREDETLSSKSDTRVVDLLEDPQRCRDFNVEFFRYETVIENYEDKELENLTAKFDGRPDLLEKVLDRLGRKEMAGSNMDLSTQPNAAQPNAAPSAAPARGKS